MLSLFDGSTMLTLQQELGGTKAYELQPLAEERSVVNDHICYSATIIRSMFWLRQTRPLTMLSLFDGSTMLTLQQELGGTKAYELQPLAEERSVVNDHICYSATKFAVCVTEGQDKLPTLYWLPKLHKRPYKARFIANASSCTTTELSKLLTSCLTAIKHHVIKYCDNVFEISGRNLFWSIKNSNEVLNKLKSRQFRAFSLFTYDFSTLYITLPHNLIKEKKLNDLIEWKFS